MNLSKFRNQQGSADVADHAGAWCRETAAEQEPEIVGLLASHYRALLGLGQLTGSQRRRLRQLIVDCETRLAEDLERPQADCSGQGARGGSEVAWPVAERHANVAPRQRQHQKIDCLTAIRLYTAGARKALTNGNVDSVVSALAKIEAMVTQAHNLLSATQSASGER